MPFNLTEYSEDLSSLCTTYAIKRLELFGSASRADFDPEESDLDFLVEFADGSSMGAFERYFGFKEALEALFERPVDLVEAKSIKNPYFRRAVDQEKTLIYGT